MSKCILFETMSAMKDMQVEKKNGLMTLRGVFGECGVMNNNRRIYEKSNYAAMVSEMKERIARDGGIPGELEHPQTMNITLENVSHKITDINIDENGLVTGEIQLLDTPKGKIAQAIVEGGLPLYVSSRATGNVDKNGRVTLERLATFDAVGTPGFSQARVKLAESQVYESLADNIVMISEKENNDDMNNQELLEKLETMEARLAKAEERAAVLEAQLKENNLKDICENIQNWCINEFAPTIQGWITEEFVPDFTEEIVTENKKVFVKEIAPKIQEWVVEHFAPEIEKWVVEQYSPEIEKWVVEQYSPEIEKWVTGNVANGIQEWCVSHFAPEVENWVQEQYSIKVKDMIGESLKETSENKMKSITETLNLLEGLTPCKPTFNGTAISENKIDEPMYIAQMPEQYRPQYNMASTAVKESIARRASIYSFVSEGSVERFWSSVSFEEPKTSNVMEGLETITDINERNIRAAFRRSRLNHNI